MYTIHIVDDTILLYTATITPYIYLYSERYRSNKKRSRIWTSNRLAKRAWGLVCQVRFWSPMNNADFLLLFFPPSLLFLPLFPLFLSNSIPKWSCVQQHGNESEDWWTSVAYHIYFKTTIAYKCGCALDTKTHKLTHTQENMGYYRRYKLWEAPCEKVYTSILLCSKWRWRENTAAVGPNKEKKKTRAKTRVFFHPFSTIHYILAHLFSNFFCYYTLDVYRSLCAFNISRAHCRFSSFAVQSCLKVCLYFKWQEHVINGHWKKYTYALEYTNGRAKHHHVSISIKVGHTSAELPGVQSGANVRQQEYVLDINALLWIDEIKKRPWLTCIRNFFV